MEKVNELVTWLMLVISCWFIKSEYKAGDKGEPEKAPAAGPAVTEIILPVSNVTLYSERSREGSIISAGLSEMLSRQKSRKNMGRRREDRPASN